MNKKDLKIKSGLLNKSEMGVACGLTKHQFDRYLYAGEIPGPSTKFDNGPTLYYTISDIITIKQTIEGLK